MGHPLGDLLSTASPVASSCVVRLGEMLGWWTGGSGVGNWPGNLGKEQQEGKETPEIWGAKGFGEDHEKSCRNPPSAVRRVGFAAANSQTNRTAAIARRPTDALHTPSYPPIEDMRPCSGTVCGS